MSGAGQRPRVLPEEAVLLGLSLVLLVVRIHAATKIGFGDSEALYAAWALHPQASYLDHPGLVGAFARAVGGGDAPTPWQAHRWTTAIAGLFPLLFLLVARGLGAARRPAAAAAVVVLVTPQIAVGLFAMTPDLLLAPMWIAALGLAHVGLTAPPGSARSAVALAFAGLAAGIGTSAKASGALLLLALLLTYGALALRPARPADEPDALRTARRNARSAYPWVGLALAGMVLTPVVSRELALGHPMLAHRLVDTQVDAGLSLRNLGSVLGGQLLYVSPVLAWMALVVARDLVRRRHDDVASRILFASFAVPVVPLLLVSIWSRVAEPHWLAPPLLALALHGARRASAVVSARVTKAGVAVAAAMTAAAHAFVLVPSASRLVPASADVRADLARELYGWPDVAAAVREESLALAAGDLEARDVVVVGPHWTLCAQLAAALEDRLVGCATPVPDDFDGWLPRNRWRSAARVIYVTDDVFGGDGTRVLPSHAIVSERTVEVRRGTKVARRFRLVSLARRQLAWR